jgi:tRNA threonylcarbamoyladenosine biosynthesis protein TsaB
VQLAIDCVSDEPGLVLAVDGVGPILTWNTKRNHSVELLPHIDRSLTQAQRGKDDIEAIFIDIGPGAYAALRVGVSIAKALSHELAVPLAGVGRLELDAYAVSGEADGRRIVSVHAAGRGDVAWAAYRQRGDDWVEESGPRLSGINALTAQLTAGDALTGDVDETLLQMAQRAGAVVLAASQHRVAGLARLGHQRLAQGRTDDPTTLVPVYLRAPAIGPQS